MLKSIITDTQTCKYVTPCGWCERRNEECKLKPMSEKISKERALNFYRDLCRVVYGDADKCCGGVMSVSLIADHMEIGVDLADQFCDAMIEYGITERQNGLIVV